MLPGPPTLYQTLLADPRRVEHDLSSLRLGVTGAAVVPVDLVHAMGSQLGFTTVLTAYGLTESCGTVTMCRRSDLPEIVAGTSGRAIPGLEVRAVADGRAVSPGEPGEIVVRGYTVMSGYWGDAEATAEAIDADGWLHTGDVGVMDEAGNVAITDRVKDMYVVGGFNAYPAEVEAILRRNDLRLPGRGGRRARRAPRRGRLCLRRGGPLGGGDRPRRDGAYDPGLVPRCHGQLQSAPQCGPGRHPPGERQRQGAQAGAARAPCRRC